MPEEIFPQNTVAPKVRFVRGPKSTYLNQPVLTKYTFQFFWQTCHIKISDIPLIFIQSNNTLSLRLQVSCNPRTLKMVVYFDFRKLGLVWNLYRTVLHMCIVHTCIYMTCDWCEMTKIGPIFFLLLKKRLIINLVIQTVKILLIHFSEGVETDNCLGPNISRTLVYQQFSNDSFH